MCLLVITQRCVTCAVHVKSTAQCTAPCVQRCYISQFGRPFVLKKGMLEGEHQTRAFSLLFNVTRQCVHRLYMEMDESNGGWPRHTQFKSVLRYLFGCSRPLTRLRPRCSIKFDSFPIVPRQYIHNGRSLIAGRSIVVIYRPIFVY